MKFLQSRRIPNPLSALALLFLISEAAPSFGMPTSNLDLVEMLCFRNKTSPTAPQNDGVKIPWPVPDPRMEVVTQGSAGLDEPLEFAIGPNGRIYVSSGYQLPVGQVLCYESDGTPNTAVNAELASYATQSGMQIPCGLVFGSDNRLYVADVADPFNPNQRGTSTVFCYQLAEFFPGNSGWFALTSPAQSGLRRPSFLTVRPAGAGAKAGNLLVSDFASSSVKEFVLRTSADFNGTNEGSFLGNFLSVPDAANLLYGDDGSLYVAFPDLNSVKRYTGLGATGALLSVLAPTPGNPESLETPQGLAFGPDGMLYVGSHGAERILRYRLPTSSTSPGIFDCVFASGLGDPACIHFRQTQPAGSSFCEGSSIASTCCGGNGGSPLDNRGCPNSAYPGGAQLFGTIDQLNPGEIRLSAWGMPPTTICLFLQSATPINPHVYGDGARCIGGSIKRIAAKAIANGAAAYPQPGDPDIRTRSAALGDPIPSGAVRYYQGYYRENASPCSGGHSFNMTSGYSVTWP